MDNNEGGGRSTILGSFLRGRPRNHSQSQPTFDLRQASPPPSPNPATSPTVGFSNILRRNITSQPATAVTSPAIASSPLPSTSGPAPSHRIRLVPHLESRRTLKFDAITRDIKEGEPAIRIGRFTDRSGLGLAAANGLNSNKLAFKSKVVSRAHAEIWVEAGGGFFIKDTKSSSGTFLNHTRLSPAGTESKKMQIRDGDILQLGVDYQGGAEDVYKSVKIRVEIGREWQASANAFNTSALQSLKALATGSVAAKTGSLKSTIPDCCICLFAVTIRQALFIAPCSHTFHYKCIRPLLTSHHPAFSCPLCRTYADLEEDVEVEPPITAAGDDDEDPVALTAVVMRPDQGAETEVEMVVDAPQRRSVSPLSEDPAEDVDMELVQSVTDGHVPVDSLDLAMADQEVGGSALSDGSGEMAPVSEGAGSKRKR